MPTGGLVIKLVEEPAAAEAARRMLAVQDDLELGEATDPRALPAVLVSTSADATDTRLRELGAHPGILTVDVVYVGFDEDDPVPSNPFDRPRSRRRGTRP